MSRSDAGPRRSSALLLLAFAVLSAWLGTTFGMWGAATGTFRVLSERENPPLAEKFRPIEKSRRAALLRHAAGEVNRRFFRGWNGAQLLAGALVLLLLWSDRRARAAAGGRGALLAAGGAFLFVLAHAFWFGPQIERLGRMRDLAERARDAASLRLFGVYHAAYVLTDLGKAGLLLAALWFAYRRIADAA